jgi:hypothetical protein
VGIIARVSWADVLLGNGRRHGSAGPFRPLSLTIMAGACYDAAADGEHGATRSSSAKGHFAEVIT